MRIGWSQKLAHDKCAKVQPERNVLEEVTEESATIRTSDSSKIISLVPVDGKKRAATWVEDIVHWCEASTQELNYSSWERTIMEPDNQRSLTIKWRAAWQKIDFFCRATLHSAAFIIGKSARPFICRHTRESHLNVSTYRNMFSTIWYNEIWTGYLWIYIVEFGLTRARQTGLQAGLVQDRKTA